MKSRTMFFIITIITAVLLYVSINGFFEIKGANQMRLGLDIRGGVDTTLEPKDLGRPPTNEELDAVKLTIIKRLDDKNITNYDVTTDDKNGKIHVRFPWKSDAVDFDPQKAVLELCEPAKLTFKELNGRVVIDSSHIETSSTAINPQDNKPCVNLILTRQGARLYDEATGRLIGKDLYIYMDDTLISSFVIQCRIPDGRACIPKLNSMSDATELSSKINSGYLPFALSAKNCHIINPILGSDALSVMVLAGQIAFALVCLFMLCYYRVPGLVACIALTLQLSIQLLALSIPQIALTLPGICGIILSIGIGVDANVIVSERIKKELSAGNPWRFAIDEGFRKSFSSVFNSNIAGIILSIVLILFGTRSIFSFGYTLLIGIIMNFVAGFAASNLMLRSLIEFKCLRKQRSFGAKEVEKE